MKRIQRWFKEKKREFMDLAIARKIRILLFVVSLLPLVCTLFISNQLSALIIRNQTTELIQANLEQSASNVENFWQTYEGSGDYVVGLEPANSSVYGRLYHEERGNLHMMEPFAKENKKLVFTFLEGKEELEAVKKEAEELKKKQ